MRILPCAEGALLLAAFAAPASGQDDPTPVQSPPAESPAPGNGAGARAAGALDRLFESLREAGSPEVARGIEQVIWSIWLDAESNEVDRLVALSIEAMNSRDLSSARSYLDRVVELEPDFAEGWNKRATVSFLQRDYARSLEDIRRVLRLEPRHFGALSGLGMILENVGRKAEALEAFRRALAIHPQMPAVQRRVEALALEVEGRPL